MKFAVAVFALFLTSPAFAGPFKPDNAIPAQLQGAILQSLEENCGAGERQELLTTVTEAAGETYFETTFSAEGRAAGDLVISGIGRLGGMGVIKVDCGNAKI
ncbi:MAG: hypothetical protein EOP11_14075 [Proteobacteria bacterium]|nr:MAG: hypothetical protein EOP11_14075 [Pseudomonadota bacterium]